MIIRRIPETTVLTSSPRTSWRWTTTMESFYGWPVQKERTAPSQLPMDSDRFCNRHCKHGKRKESEGSGSTFQPNWHTLFRYVPSILVVVSFMPMFVLVRVPNRASVQRHSCTVYWIPSRNATLIYLTSFLRIFPHDSLFLFFCMHVYVSAGLLMCLLVQF